MPSSSPICSTGTPGALIAPSRTLSPRAAAASSRPMTHSSNRSSTALRWHVQAGRPFDLARTQLCFGERLRRDQAASEGPRTTAGCLEDIQRPRRSPLGRAVPRRDRGERSTSRPSTARPVRPSHATGTPGRAGRSRRCHQPRGGIPPLYRPQDRGIPPEAYLRQARYLSAGTQRPSRPARVSTRDTTDPGTGYLTYA